MSTSHKIQGFTVIELLMILLIVGVLFSVLIVNMNTQLGRSNLQQATSQVAADIERIRSASIRSSTDTTMTIDSTGRKYTLTLDGQDTAINLPGTVVLKITLPTSSTAISKVTYSAPYGTVAANGLLVNLSVPNTTLNKQFYLMGITGKVTE